MGLLNRGSNMFTESLEKAFTTSQMLKHFTQTKMLNTIRDTTKLGPCKPTWGFH